MRIPVFVSSPTQLSEKQKASYDLIASILDEFFLEPRALGRSDYPKDVPIKEVFAIAKHCHGGVILGFEQFRATSGVWKSGTAEQREVQEPVLLPTPWNQLEAGILFGLRIPLLVFREMGVVGGIFDVGTAEVFVHDMPGQEPSSLKRRELKEIFLKWYAEVSRNYYEY